MRIKIILALHLVSRGVSAFWDVGTTTIDPSIARWDQQLTRHCRFRWQQTESSYLGFIFRWWDWDEIEFRRRLYVVAGLSIDFINLTTGAILNRRTILTSANPLDPYMDQQKKIRIWALGRQGCYDTPWRYRVWRVTRMFPKSLNVEHCHGPHCYHQPRHDVAIVHSFDQMYVYYGDMNYRYQFALRTYIPEKRQTLQNDILWFSGCGYEYLQHVYENYKIFYTKTAIDYVVDCSKYLPKWWGKFICLKNHDDLPCIQNGAPLFQGNFVMGIGCFEIRYNEDRIMVWTDLRYYVDWINFYGFVRPGEYYEYAYPQWGVIDGWFSTKIKPYIPLWQVKDYGMYPLG